MVSLHVVDRGVRLAIYAMLIVSLFYSNRLAVVHLVER